MNSGCEDDDDDDDGVNSNENVNSIVNSIDIDDIYDTEILILILLFLLRLEFNRNEFIILANYFKSKVRSSRR